MFSRFSSSSQCLTSFFWGPSCTLRTSERSTADSFCLAVRDLQTLDLPLDSLRRRVMIYTGLAWFCSFLNTAFMAYGILTTKVTGIEAMLSPLTTQITQYSPSILTASKIIICCVNLYSNAAWSFSTAATCTICAVLSDQFRRFNSMFKTAIDEEGTLR